jgi:hypothetical protein
MTDSKWNDRLGPPIPPGPYTWWAAPSEEGPFFNLDLPEDTPLDAAAEEAFGRATIAPEAGGWLCLARRGHVDLSSYFDVVRWLEDAHERMEESDEDGPDEDGHQSPLGEISRKDELALEETVRAAIRQWQIDRSLPLKRYWLDMKGSAQWVGPVEEDADA